MKKIYKMIGLSKKTRFPAHNYNGLFCFSHGLPPILLYIYQRFASFIAASRLKSSHCSLYTGGFAAAICGKIVYFAVCWRNNKGTDHWGPVFSGLVG
jgi:hypothetical protein